MTNENCLEGIRCPQCGNDERLLIVATILADVTDDGADIAEGSQMHWDDSSLTRCPECDRDGPLKEFRVPSELPPNPDGLNDQRAQWAGDVIAGFRAATGTEEEDAVCDLLADLMHWCDRHRQDFGRHLIQAQDHYTAETLGEDAIVHVRNAK